MRGMSEMKAPEQGLVGVEIALLTDAHEVQCIAGLDQVLTMGGPAAQCMTGTMVRHMINPGVRNSTDIEGRWLPMFSICFFILCFFLIVVMCWWKCLLCVCVFTCECFFV